MLTQIGILILSHLIILVWLLRKVKQVLSKNSKFILGLYGQVWVIFQGFVRDWVEELMRLNPNKLAFSQRGLRAMKLIQQEL